ncbi:hypothetical protein PG989_013753 [Apiospora arundinis]
MRTATVSVTFYPAIIALLCGSGLTHSQDGIDNTKPAGVNVISHDHTFTTRYLGLQLADNGTSHRDLGFTGQLGGRWYAVYGDVLWCAPGVTDPADDPPGFHGMVRDAISICTDDPLVVHDLHLDAEGHILPCGEAYIEPSHFFCNGNKTGFRGAGVAKVQLLDSIPTVTHWFGDQGYWWDANSTARYGDVAAFRDPRSEHVYAWGGAHLNKTSWVDSGYVYECRVKATEVFEISRYEYWWGRETGWKSEPLIVFTAETAVMWMSGQGQVVWNAFLSCYIFVRLGPWTNDVFLRTAPLPEGPWSDDVKVFTATPTGHNGMTYAGVAHPYLDPSGRSMVISYTNNNNIEVIKVTFG